MSAWPAEPAGTSVHCPAPWIHGGSGELAWTTPAVPLTLNPLAAEGGRGQQMWENELKLDVPVASVLVEQTSWPYTTASQS